MRHANLLFRVLVAEYGGDEFTRSEQREILITQ